jgi:hypothetical protein
MFGASQAIVVGVLVAILVGVPKAVRARTFDLSEIEALKKWMARLPELSSLVQHLNEAFKKNGGLDQAEVKRFRTFFHGTDFRGPELNIMLGDITLITSRQERLESRVTGMEKDLKETSNRIEHNLDDVSHRLDNASRRLDDIANTMRHFLARLPPPPGMRSDTVEGEDEDDILRGISE